MEISLENIADKVCEGDICVVYIGIVWISWSVVVWVVNVMRLMGMRMRKRGRGSRG